MFQELIANALAKGALNMIGIPGIVGLAGAGLVGWKLMKDATKPLLLLVLLAIGGGMAWWFWPKGGSGSGWPRWAGRAPIAPQPQYPCRLPKYRPTKPPEPPLPPLSPLQQVRPFIDRVQVERIEKGKKEHGTWPPPRQWRDANLAQARARNEERRRKEELIARAEDTRGFASVAPAPPAPRMMTLWEARSQALDMHDRRINEVQALSRRIAEKYGQQPTRIGGLDHERRWR